MDSYLKIMEQDHLYQDQIYKIVKENNEMLKEIIKFINYYNSRSNQENENDFLRNILANLVSNGFNIKNRQFP